MWTWATCPHKSMKVPYSDDQVLLIYKNKRGDLWCCLTGSDLWQLKIRFDFKKQMCLLDMRMKDMKMLDQQTGLKAARERSPSDLCGWKGQTCQMPFPHLCAHPSFCGSSTHPCIHILFIDSFHFSLIHQIFIKPWYILGIIKMLEICQVRKRMDKGIFLKYNKSPLKDSLEFM